MTLGQCPRQVGMGNAMGAREDTRTLNDLTVQTVGGLLGLTLPIRGMARCPFKDHEDSKPSFEVRSAEQRWVCYSCDRRGGAIDLVMVVRGLTFVEAKHWLAEKIGMAANHRRSGVPKRRFQPPPPSRTASREAHEEPPDHALYAAFLVDAPLGDTGRAYLHQRAIDDTTIARFKIAQMPGITVMRELVRQYGFARVEAGGLLIQRSTPQRFWPIFPPGALLFPYFEAGSIAYLQARIISEQVDGGRWRNLNHRRRRIYNADVLTRADVRRVSICEGAMDVLSATQLGREAAGLIGVSARLTHEQLIGLRGKQVDLLLDWDTAGEKRARTMLKELNRFGIAATRKDRPSPSAEDVNDYLQERSRSA